jgi:hypothetical protein
MEENKLKKDHLMEAVIIPRDYLRGPIFASKKQTAGRIVKLKKYERIYEIGGFEPLPSNNKKSCPALDIRHGRALFTMLTFYEKNSENKIRFSLNQFCKRYANSNGGRYTKDVKTILNDLISCWFRVTYSNGEQSTYRILKDVSIHSKLTRRKLLETEMSKREFWLDEVELHPEFCRLLSEYAELGQINLRILTSLRSPLAQSIYTYMPSRVIDRFEENAFEISLTKLLQEVGHTIPTNKWLRKQLFTQNEKPITEQLDGLDFSKGVLRVKLVETEDGEDYKMLFWNGGIKTKIERELNSLAPKLRSYWMKSGRTEESFNKKIKRFLNLENYQKDVLSRATIKLEGNESFMRIALSLLGRNRFDELASEVKSMVLELSHLRRDPTKIFISLVCEDLATRD